MPLVRLNKLFGSILFALCLLKAGAVWAQTPPTPPGAASAAISAPRSDKEDYLNDRVKFSYARSVTRIKMTDVGRALDDVCMPAFTTLRGIGTQQRAGDTTVSPTFEVTEVGKSGCADADDKKKPAKGDEKKLAKGDVVMLSVADLQSLPPDRFGLTYGTLLVPYKYHLKGSKSFTGAASLGGYVGYRQERSGLLGLGVQYVVFIGAASVPVSNVVDGKPVTDNHAGVSYGVGLIGTVKDGFNMGLVLGADRVSKSAGYVDNGKMWIAVQLGYAFSN
jgi:hypothetical protein